MIIMLFFFQLCIMKADLFKEYSAVVCTVCTVRKYITNDADVRDEETKDRENAVICVFNVTSVKVLLCSLTPNLLLL